MNTKLMCIRCEYNSDEGCEFEIPEDGSVTVMQAENRHTITVKEMLYEAATEGECPAFKMG